MNREVSKPSTECPCYRGNQLACDIHGPLASEPPTGPAQPPHSESDLPPSRRGSETGGPSPHISPVDLVGRVRRGIWSHADDDATDAQQALDDLSERLEEKDTLADLEDAIVRRLQAQVAELEEQLEAVREELSDMAQLAYEGNEREKVLEEKLEAAQEALREIAGYECEPHDADIIEAHISAAYNDLAKIAREALYPASRPKSAPVLRSDPDSDSSSDRAEGGASPKGEAGAA